MTREAFLAALEAAFRKNQAAWSTRASRIQGLTILDNFMRNTRETLEGTANLVDIDSPSFVEAWHAIGGKGKPTYKALRALPPGDNNGGQS